MNKDNLRKLSVRRHGHATFLLLGMSELKEGDLFAILDEPIHKDKTWIALTEPTILSLGTGVWSVEAREATEPEIREYRESVISKIGNG